LPRKLYGGAVYVLILSLHILKVVRNINKRVSLEFVHQTEKHVGPFGAKQTQQHPKIAFGDLSIDRTCVC
jgi:hypothetical protein